MCSSDLVGADVNTASAPLLSRISGLSDTLARNIVAFRDENGQPVQYDSGKMPGANILWSPRLGFNYDIAGDQKTQIRGGSGVFTGQPLYVWISNQLGNTGMLQGSFSTANTAAYPFSTNVDKYKPAPTGQPPTFGGSNSSCPMLARGDRARSRRRSERAFPGQCGARGWRPGRRPGPRRPEQAPPHRGPNRDEKYAGRISWQSFPKEKHPLETPGFLVIPAR